MNLTQHYGPKYDQLIKSMFSVCVLLFLTAIGDTYSQVLQCVHDRFLRDLPLSIAAGLWDENG